MEGADGQISVSPCKRDIINRISFHVTIYGTFLKIGRGTCYLSAREDSFSSHCFHFSDFTTCLTSWRRGRILMTSPVRVLTTMLLPMASMVSMLSVRRFSHGRAVKAYGLDVRAPTGHRSITLPDSSVARSFSTYVPTCMSEPRPVVPKSSTPATSLANLRGAVCKH